MELMKKAVVPLREGWDEGKAILELCHMKTQATALSQGGGPQKCGEAL